MTRRPRIAVLNYGMGNRESVAKALQRVGAEPEITDQPARLASVDGLVLVGVGAFPEAMRQIRSRRLDSVLRGLYERGTPILGICLGLQLLFDGSEEHGGAEGLRFLPGAVKKLQAPGLRLPHIGWNAVEWRKPSRLLAGLPDDSVFYHVHSYAVKPQSADVVLGTTRYGHEEVSAIEEGSLFGVQFHPEKSSGYGLRLLHNFTELCAGVEPRVGQPMPPIGRRSGGRDLRKRIIPCLDVNAGRVVKGTNFVDLRDAGDPIELAERYDAAGADEVAFLDITATHEKRETMVELAQAAVRNVFVPITIGGGIRSAEDAQAVLDAGADNVSVNSAAVADPDLLDSLVEIYANQNVVLALDAKRRVDGADWEVYVAGGRQPTGRDAVAWAVEAVGRGAGQVLVTSMDRDGTRAGYDVPLVRAIAEAVDVPVIASGGAGTPEHLEQALEAGADAVLCASVFHYGDYTVQDIKDHLAASAIPVTPAHPERPPRRVEQAPIAVHAA
jgi:imidazole glycerol-phosphate synthase subunit HisF